jgi:hypothetical protein
MTEFRNNIEDVWDVSLQPVACWGCGFEHRGGPGCLSLVNFECCEIEAIAMGRNIVQRSPTKCGVSVCDLETSTLRRSRPERGCCAKHKEWRRWNLQCLSVESRQFGASVRSCIRVTIVHTLLFVQGKTTFILSCLHRWTSLHEFLPHTNTHYETRHRFMQSHVTGYIILGHIPNTNPPKNQFLFIRPTTSTIWNNSFL